MTAQVIVSPGGAELLVLPRDEHAALLARAIEGGAPGDEAARAQIIAVGNGEELVILSRRDHDVLLAWAGDEDADDRLVTEWVQRELAQSQPGDEELVPMSPERLRRAEAAYNVKQSGRADDQS